MTTSMLQLQSIARTGEEVKKKWSDWASTTKVKKRQTESVPPNDRGWGWDARRHRDRTQGAVNNWTRRHRQVWRLDRYGDNADDWPTQRSLRRITSATRTLAIRRQPYRESPGGTSGSDVR